jgi:cysteine desulfuration protein SufE
MSPLAQKQHALIADFDIIFDHQERLTAAIDRAKRVPALPPEDKISAHRVAGCTSPVWLIAAQQDGRMRFRGDADSLLVRALVLLLCEFYNDGTPAEIAATDPALFDRMGVTENLSPTRRHGLGAVQTRIRRLAEEVAPGQ